MSLLASCSDIYIRSSKKNSLIEVYIGGNACTKKPTLNIDAIMLRVKRLRTLFEGFHSILIQRSTLFISHINGIVSLTWQLAYVISKTRALT